MKLEVDSYTKFILTVIAFALLLNAVTPIFTQAVNPSPVDASDRMEVRVTDIRTTWPQKIEIVNWPRSMQN